MRRSITIVTYNVRHCLGLSSKVDLSAVVQTLRDAIGTEKNCNERSAGAVVICLQELDSLNPRSGFISQDYEIARQLHVSCFPATVLSFFGLFGFGNAILTNAPVHSTWNRFLPWGVGEPRKVQRLRIGVDNCPVDIYNTHWGLMEAERINSAGCSAELIRKNSKDIPAVFCGDFNAEIESTEMQFLMDESSLINTGLEGNLKTYPSDNPRKRIDHILISKHLVVEEVKTVQSTASDHLPLAASLSFEG